MPTASIPTASIPRPIPLTPRLCAYHDARHAIATAFAVREATTGERSPRLVSWRDLRDHAPLVARALTPETLMAIFADRAR